MTDGTTRVLLRRERLLAWTCGALIVLLFCTTAGSIAATALALQARQDTANRSTARITSLQADLRATRAEVATNKADLAAANTRIEALTEQLSRLGAAPIVAVDPPPTSSTSTRPAPTSPTTPPPTTTAPPSTQPEPAPEPSPPPNPQPRPQPEPAFPCRAVFVPVLCTEGTTNRKARP